MQKSIAEDLPRMLRELKEAFFGEEGGFLAGLKKLAEIFGLIDKDGEKNDVMIDYIFVLISLFPCYFNLFFSKHMKSRG